MDATNTLKEIKKKVLTLVYIRDEENILLGLKKRGFGTGKWNGFGGKVQPGESIVQGSIYEHPYLMFAVFIRKKNLKSTAG